MVDPQFAAAVKAGAIGSKLGGGGYIGLSKGYIYQKGRSIRQILQTPINIPKSLRWLNPKNLFRNAVLASALPATAATAGFGEIVSGTKGAVVGFKNLFQRAVHNPFAGVSFPQGLKNIGSRALGAYTAITSFSLAKSAITGDPFTPIPTGNKLKDIIAFGLNPIGAVAGIVGGVGKKGVQEIVDIFKPEIPAIPENINYPELPSTNQYFDFGGAPAANLAPSYSAPSFSFSQGGNEAALFALAAALGLGGGYLLGKRKRKRKKAKYKKRRKH